MAGQAHDTPPHGNPALPPATIDLREDDERTRSWGALEWPAADVEARVQAQGNEEAAEEYRPVRSPFPFLGRLAIAALLFTVLAWIAVPSALSSGTSGAGLIVIVIVVFVAWFLLSFFLRVAGWVVGFISLAAAILEQATVADTAVRFFAGFLLWLCGHYVFTWKHGEWHSRVAESILGRLPDAIRPDARYFYRRGIRDRVS